MGERRGDDTSAVTLWPFSSFATTLLVLLLVVGPPVVAAIGRGVGRCLEV